MVAHNSPEQRFRRTGIFTEREELRKWVKSGNSVHSNPGLWAYENGNEMDFLDALRFEDGLEGFYSKV
jgi:hypothetical protein